MKLRTSDAGPNSKTAWEKKIWARSEAGYRSQDGRREGRKVADKKKGWEKSEVGLREASECEEIQSLGMSRGCSQCAQDEVTAKCSAQLRFL